ncbi:MAG: DUF2232 domain-containing protein [Tatlockia sp.]|jgi:hypothetical protein
MTRLGDWLTKQGHFLIENDRLSLVYIAVLALVPFTAWLSAAVVALITLRKGLADGLKGLVVAVVAYTALSSMSMAFPSALISAMVAFVPCYLTAAVLHTTASWRIAGAVLVLQTLLLIALIHGLVPEFIMKQYQYLQAVFQEMEKEGSGGALSGLLGKQDEQAKQVMANYFIGIQSLTMLLSAVSSLLLARFVQSGMYYPGGFGQEMRAFRASSFGVVILLLTAFGAYQLNPFAISCLPVLVMYYVCAGLSLSYLILAKNKGFGTLILLLIPLLFMPFVTVPVYTLLGALDSLFNFRLHLPTKTGGKEKKG